MEPITASRVQKALAIITALAIGAFLSIASHAFSWSDASVFAVGTAFAVVIGIFGSALIVQPRGMRANALTRELVWEAIDELHVDDLAAWSAEVRRRYVRAHAEFNHQRIVNENSAPLEQILAVATRADVTAGPRRDAGLNELEIVSENYASDPIDRPIEASAAAPALSAISG